MSNSRFVTRPLVTAIGVDIGFGHTKIVAAAQSGETSNAVERNARFDVITFPSIVILHRGSLSNGDVLGSSAQDAIHDGEHRYLYGQSAADGDDGASGRPLDHTFASSIEYSVLLKASLAKRGYPVTVERLVLGVPFDRLQTAASTLKSRFTGTQTVNGHECDVREVRVVAQPVAGFFWQLHASGRGSVVDKYTCLTCDVGYRTFDWACTRGLRLIEPRCGSSTGGVSRLVRHISEELSGICGEDCSTLSMRSRIEQCLRERASFIEIGTRRFTMSQFNPTLEKIIDASLLQMVESIGSTTDITDILVVGGGCDLYLPALIRRFPHKRVLPAPEPQFAIARGLQLLANM